jgi:outer membrane protein assembly factor BamB
MVYFSAGSYLFAVDSRNGHRLWKTAGIDYQCSPAIADDGALIVSTSRPLPDGKEWVAGVERLDAETGKAEWQFPMGQGASTAPVLGANGTVYAGYSGIGNSAKGRLYALDGRSGDKKWYFDADGPINTAPSVGSDGTIYFGTTTGTEYALSPDGTRRWATSLGASVGTPAAIGRFGLMYLGTNDGTIYALDTLTGAKATRPGELQQ